MDPETLLLVLLPLPLPLPLLLPLPAPAPPSWRRGRRPCGAVHGARLSTVLRFVRLLLIPVLPVLLARGLRAALTRALC